MNVPQSDNPDDDCKPDSTCSHGVSAGGDERRPRRDERIHPNAFLQVGATVPPPTPPSGFSRLKDVPLPPLDGVPYEEEGAPPLDSVSPEDIDALVNFEMNRLSIEEREHTINDIHGVADEVHETPVFVQGKLYDLEESLYEVQQQQACRFQPSPGDGTYAYLLALQKDPVYVQDPALRLSFLRATRFDVTRATRRIIDFFRVKLELFGEELLARDVYQSDLAPEEIPHLHSGYQQVLPARDRGGRTVNLWVPALLSGSSYQTILRCMFYAFMALSRSEETQKKGIVDVGYFVKYDFSDMPKELAWKVPKLRKTLPLRVSALHFCSDSFLMHPILSLGMFVSNAVVRTRLRWHYGSHMDCLKSLQAFGVPTYAMPFDDHGTPSCEQGRSDWEERGRYESAMVSNRRGTGADGSAAAGAAVVVTVPGVHDVLLGRGRHSHKQPGNKGLRGLIEKYWKRYEVSDKHEKTILAYTIVRIIQERSGRFLKHEEGVGYLMVDDAVARAKVAHSFRSHRSALRRVVGGGAANQTLSLSTKSPWSDP